MQETTLILGGTGKTGRRVAKRLRERLCTVKVASRSGQPTFDWSLRDSWEAALVGVTSVYLAYYPDLAAPGAAAHIREFSKLAVESGVRRIVLLSGRGEDQVLPSEQAVRDSGAEFTILRAAWFCQNFSEGYLRDGIMSGTLAFPAAGVAEPFVDAEDIAEVAVAALSEQRHVGQTYELSGPRLLTFADAVEEISHATARAIRYVPISMQAYAVELERYLPADYVTFMTELFSHVLDGHNAHLADGVERALGRPARDFSRFLQQATAAGAWA
jgi:uncharacterized protein YbjT (DUF2867 family)